MFGAFNTFGKLGSPAGSRSLLAQIQSMGASFIGIPSLSNYQDSAGTTLVTQPGGGAADPPVGKVLDLSGLGNHATQSTSTARPKLSARVNLLTYTEDFSNSVWAKIGASTSVSKIIATAGAGAHYVRHLSSLTSATALSVEVKKDNHDWIFIGPSDAKLSFFNTATGNFGTLDSDVVSSSSVLLSDGYWRISLISNSAALTNLCALGLAASNGVTSFTAAGTEAFFVRNASLVFGSTAARYQRVTDANNYDYSGFPLIHQFDAVDDAHVITFGSSLGSDCTVVTANRGTTPTIATAQTIGTSYTITTSHAAKIIFPRALTAAETAIVTAWATKQGAIA